MHAFNGYIKKLHQRLRRTFGQVNILAIIIFYFVAIALTIRVTFAIVAHLANEFYFFHFTCSYTKFLFIFNT